MGPSVVLCLVETRLITRPTSAGPIWTIERSSAYSAKTAANARRDSSRTLICPASKGLDPCPSCEGAPRRGDLRITYPVSAATMRRFVRFRASCRDWCICRRWVQSATPDCCLRRQLALSRRGARIAEALTLAGLDLGGDSH